MGEAHSVPPSSPGNFLFSHVYRGSKIVRVFAFQVVHLVSIRQFCWQCFHSNALGLNQSAFGTCPKLALKSKLLKDSLRKRIVGKFSTVKNEAFHIGGFLFSINFSEQSHWTLSAWFPDLVSCSQPAHPAFYLPRPAFLTRQNLRFAVFFCILLHTKIEIFVVFSKF